jgi:predicted phage tail protein
LRKDGIEIEEEDGNHIDVEGYVRNLAGNTFMVGDTLVNAGTLSLAGIANGVKVEVEGSYLNGILIASEIDIQDGTVPPPTTVPAAPAVSAVGGVKQVTISWNGVSGATSYNIYWSTTAGVTGTLLANATSSPYMQTGLTAATTYYYVVRAVNAAGEGAPSVQVSATTAPTAPQPPSAPTGVTTTVVSPTQVNVSWSAVTGAVSYNIYWSTTTGVTPATGTLIANATSPYSHTGRTASTTYFYVVTAVNAAGESAPSAQASATTTATPMPPAAPTGVTAVGGTNQVTVSWATVTGATSYNLYWSTTAGVTPATGTLIANVTSPFVHMGRAASTTYYYVVTAVNSVGSSAPSAQVSATTAAAPLVCGTCHAIPPATGAHDFHVNSLGYSCAICHGTGYSSTAVNTTLHLNNVVNVVSNLGWNATTSTCATPGCHGSRGW